MEYFKDFGLKVLIILFTMIMVTQAEIVELIKNDTSKIPVVMGNCSCGGFPTETPESDATPLLARTVLEVPCTAAGEHTCCSLCMALASTSRAKGPDVFCAKLGNASNLKLAAFYKTCDQPWSYSGLKSEEPLCCEDSHARPCPSALVANSTVPNNDDK